MSLVRWVGLGACALVLTMPLVAFGQPEPAPETSSSTDLLEKIQQDNVEAAKKAPPQEYTSPPVTYETGKPEPMMTPPTRTAKVAARPVIDMHDPWGAPTPPVARGFAPSPARKAPLEFSDPWGPRTQTVSTPAPAPRAPSSATAAKKKADEALRAAIDAAVDAGDKERALRLLQIWFATR